MRHGFIMARNVPTPGDSIVPSASAERRRIFADDAAGIPIYLVAVLMIGAAILAVVALA